MEPKKIYVCSPYKGKEENYKKAVEYCKYVAAQGHIPFASHVMLHGILNDQEDRTKGLTAGIEMIKLVDEVWIFGGELTSGMEAEAISALLQGKTIFYILNISMQKIKVPV